MKQEPAIAVGLIENAESVSFELLDEFTDHRGNCVPPGRYGVSSSDGKLVCTGVDGVSGGEVSLKGSTARSRFRLQVTIGIEFHWQQQQLQTFGGDLRFLVRPGNRITVINDVPLELYILSVSCSEMSGNSPEEFLKAHSIISRSWLLAQLESKRLPSAQVPVASSSRGEIIRWYDRQAHADFDVCADDHCQRYQGLDRIASGAVSAAVGATRGVALVYGGAPCDARFSKCCGGVTEDFRLAWSDTVHPYLVPIPDRANHSMPHPPLSDEVAARDFVMTAPDAYCNCSDQSILSRVLNDYDRATHDFFRWRVRLTPDQIEGFLKKKLAVDLGRVLALDPVERGLSGRLKRLRVTGEKGTIVIGKELEIRRALSSAHLYSSAFVVDTEGPAERPDAFILTGAGWGHGVGLCQIGAAVMACRGIGHEEILGHYYPGSTLERIYE